MHKIKCWNGKNLSIRRDRLSLGNEFYRLKELWWVCVSAKSRLIEKIIIYLGYLKKLHNDFRVQVDIDVVHTQ